MKICIEIGKKKKPKQLELQERWYIEEYEGKPRYIVTDKNMYSEGYIRCGWAGNYKRWELNGINRCNRVLIELKRGEKIN